MDLIAMILFYVAAILIVRCRLVNSQLEYKCKSMTSNARMLSEVIKSPLVYTALQCHDRCLRMDRCDGFNFKQRGENETYSKCQLLDVHENATLSAKNGFMFIKVNRSAIRQKWLLPSCNAVNPRQVCERKIDACGKLPYQCKKGYLDDGNGTCSLIGCNENAYLSGENKEIKTPSFLENECNATTPLLYQPFTCYYIVSLDTTENVTLHFSQFQLYNHRKDKCSTANQYVEITAEDINNPATMRLCGNHGNIHVESHIVAKRLYIKFHSDAYKDPCVSLTGRYGMS